MGRINVYALLAVIGTFVSCAGVAYQDKYYQLDDVKDKELRGDKPEHDRALTDCAPETIPSGGKAFKCVVHFYPDYQALLKKLADTENALVACQQSHAR